MNSNGDAFEISAHTVLKTRECANPGCASEAGRYYCYTCAHHIIYRHFAERGIFLRGDPRSRHWRRMLGSVEETFEKVGNESFETLISRARIAFQQREREELALWEQELDGHVGHGAEMRVLIKEIRDRGYQVVTGGKHKRILDGHGRVVMDANGPLIISGSPSDANWLEMARGRLVKAGVLVEKKPRPQKRKGEGEEEPEHKTREEREREKLEARKKERADTSRDAHTRTMSIRSRIEPLVAKVGGWNLTRHVASSGVLPSELGRIAELFSQRMETPNVFGSTGAAERSASTLRAGGTLSAAHAELWEALVVDWEKAENTQMWYFERLRETRGMKDDWRVQMGITQTTLPEAPPAEEPSPEGTGDTPVTVAPEVEAPGGDLPVAYVRALRAVYMMARGSTGDDWDEILEMATRIALQQEEEE